MLKYRWLAWLLMLCLFCAGCTPDTTSSASSPSSSPVSLPDTKPDTPTEPLREIAKELTLDRELVFCAVQNSVLRIESVSPGMDTYDLSVTLYDLAEEKVLSTVELGEGAWETGWIDSGFYAISLLTKTAFLYDYSGKMVRQIPLPSDMEMIGFALLNPTCDVFLLGNGLRAEMQLYFVDTGTRKTVAPLYGYMRPLAYREGCFYLSNSDTGELLCIEENADKATATYCNKDASFLTIDCGIRSTDTNYKVAFPHTEEALYVPFDTVDEMPIAATPNRFITLVSHSDEDILTLYDPMIKQRYKLSAPPGVESVVFINGYELLLTVKTAEGHRLYVRSLDLDDAEEEELPVFATDKAPEADAPDVQQPDASVPTGSHILNVPLLSQWPEFPTGCESVSTVMALRYAGESLTVTKFIREYLPKSTNFYFEDGKKFGPSPYEHFIGSPETSSSYGCMAPVIERALTAYFGNDERVHNVTGKTLPELCAEYIDKDQPVLVWATINMLDTYPSASWYLSDGSRFSWPANEHCLVLVGYDENKYYFNDPYVGKVVGYSRSLCESRYSVLGNQALIITKA